MSASNAEEIESSFYVWHEQRMRKMLMRYAKRDEERQALTDADGLRELMTVAVNMLCVQSDKLWEIVTNAFQAEETSMYDRKLSERECEALYDYVDAFYSPS